LGGKVVWLANSELGYSQYYAHLDSQVVRSGQQVKQGDTLGMVGNTGNAITTSPHLHFGIYKSGRGAVDPFPFLQNRVMPDEPNVSDSAQIGTLALINAAVANLRAAPSTSSAILGTFKKNTIFEIEGKTGSWYRISLPDGKVGYLFENLALQVNNHIQEVELSPLDEVRENWVGNEPVSGDIISGKAQVLGQFQDSFLVETSSGLTGWWRIR
jgi:SH3-like domain-containing protein